MSKGQQWAWKFALAVLALALGAGLLAAPARADDDRGKDHRRLVASGTITAIAETEAGRDLTIDRGEADDDPADDILVRLVADTKILPKDAEPAVGMEAKALLLPAVAGEVAVAAQLVLKLEDEDEGGDHKGRELHACGSIATLPADIHDGTWVITVKDVGDYSIIADADTEIEPEDAVPALGDRACFEARKTDAGWLAKEIELKDDGEDHGRKHEVELKGLIKSLPDDRSGDWELLLTVEGRGDLAIQVTPDTKIEGELEVGARVAVRAKVSTDAAGVETLLAERIKRLGDKAGGKDRGPMAVHFEGTVTAVSDDGREWTIDDEGSVLVIHVSAETWVRGLLLGTDPVGMKAEGVAKRQEDGSLLAKFMTLSAP